MTGSMTVKERLALVHSLLNLPEELEVVDYVTVAHVHSAGEDCTGLVRLSGNRDPELTAPLLANALAQVEMRREGGGEA